jgi:motility quorum-sensing regulator/GCU-specific mRNA interferase toxin
MTTHADHQVWQDVYRHITDAGEVYLKLTVIDDVLIVSFKEL